MAMLNNQMVYDGICKWHNDVDVEIIEIKNESV